MISFFRRLMSSKLGTGLALGFLALVAFAFIAGDIGSSGSGLGSLTGFGSGSATKIGSQSLTDSDVQSRAQSVFEQQRSQNPTMQIGQFLAMGAVPEIYSQLVAGTVLGEFARQQGIYISKRMIDARIAAIPAFQDASGKFSQDVFRQMLAARGISEKALRDDIEMEIKNQLMLVPAGLGARLGNSLVLPYASLLLESREGRIAAIPSAAFRPAAAPTDAQLKAFYSAHADRYTIPEQRRLRYAVVDVERFAAAATPTESDIAKYYAAHKADYAARETRTLHQLIVPTEAAARAALGAGSLARAAKANGLEVATFATLAKGAFAQQSSPAIAEAAFAAPQGKIVGPFKTPLGWALVEAAAVQKTAEKPLAAVRGPISEALKAEKRKTLLANFVSKVENDITNGATFDEVVKDNGLRTETTPLLLSTGQSVENPAYKASADVPPLMKPAFDMEADDDAQFAPIKAQERYALLDVTDIVAPAPPPLAKVKAAIAQQYQLSQGAVKAKALADRLKAQIARGMPLDKALAAAGVALPAPQTVAGRRADLLRTDRRPPAEIAILFAMAKGSVKILPIPNDQGYFLVQLNKVQEADAAKVPGLVDRVRGDIAPVVASEYGSQFERAVERQLGVTRSPAAVARVTQALRRANGGGQ